MNCNACGSPVKDGSKFCPHCGVALEVSEPVEAPEVQAEPEVERAPFVYPITEPATPAENETSFEASAETVPLFEEPQEPIATPVPTVEQPAQSAPPVEPAYIPQPPVAPQPPVTQPSYNRPPAQQQRYAPQPQATAYRPVTDDYRVLGGFLKFLVVMYKVVSPILLGFSIVFSIVGVGSSIFTLTQYSSYYHGESSVLYLLVSMVLTVATSIAGMIFCIKFGRGLEYKDPGFLHLFQFYNIIIMPFQVIIPLFASIPIAVRLVQAAFYLFIQIISFVIWNLYFTTSVRVRTYMGTDEYLRRSIFNKNTKSPVPQYPDPQPIQTPAAAPVNSAPTYNPPTYNYPPQQ